MPVKLWIIFLVTCQIILGQPIPEEALNIHEKVIQYYNDQGWKLYDQTLQSNPSGSDLPDLHYEFKIEELDKLTPLDLRYNDQIKKYISLFSGSRKKDFEQYFSRAKLYFPIFEEYLVAYQIPIEFKYLPILESGLNPIAESKSMAVGLWQFKYHSGKLFDLRIDSYIDERSDPVKSTIAACKYLEYLYRTFGDWQLVLAAYNGGPGEVRNAIINSGGKTDFWELQSFFPEQTAAYVPKFIAILYLAKYYTIHNLTLPDSAIEYHKTDTVQVFNQISFKQISEVISVNEDMLKRLNPQYKLGIIPEDTKGLSLRLPIDKIPYFIQYENNILISEPGTNNYHTMVHESKNTIGKEKIIHTVKEGENTHKIAVRYNCTLENVKIWNNLDDINVYPGQQLIIYLDKK